MPITNAGRDHFLDATIGVAVTSFNAANARIGVGDSATAFATSQTDLVAATNKLRKIVDSAPSRSTNVLTFVSTFVAAEANWTWNEIAVFNAAAAGTMFSRLVSAMGTKASPAVWVPTLTITVSV